MQVPWNREICTALAAILTGAASRRWIPEDDILECLEHFKYSAAADGDSRARLATSMALELIGCRLLYTMLESCSDH